MGSFLSKDCHELIHRNIFNFNYGGVLLVLVESYILNMYLMIRVARARKQYNVQCPSLYSDTSVEFNCIQRGHQNYLESTLFFIPFLLISGLKYPRFATLTGTVYLIGRVCYAHGYTAENVTKRNCGMKLSMFGGLLPIVGSVGVLAVGCLMKKANTHFLE